MPRQKFFQKELEPDEIFLDSENLPGFAKESLEGRLEYPIASKNFWYLGFIIFAAVSLLWYKTFELEVIQGPSLKARAEANRLKILPLWPERGRIFDRNGEILASNDSAFRLISEKENMVLANSSDLEELEKIKESYPGLLLRVEPFSFRKYHDPESISHLVGYLGYATEEDSKGGQILKFNTLTGKSGVEEKYEKYLGGSLGLKLTEVDSGGEVTQEVIQRLPLDGKDAYLSIDSGLQKIAYQNVKELVLGRGFSGGAAVIIDVESGEILSLVSYPGFNPNTLSQGGPRKEIEAMLTSSLKPLFNRALSGLYPSGSVIKPLIALAALEEGIINPEREILSTGSISVPNPFDPTKPNIFYDWKEHGWVDMRKAIAVSSNVYFYTIGGGYEETKGLGVKKIQAWLNKFGFGEKTGIDIKGEKEGFVPSPEWKAETQSEDPIWRVGDTYNLSIGQGNFQVTPLQMALFAATLANEGRVLEPTIIKTIKDKERVIYEVNTKARKTLKFKQENLKVIKEGMRLATEFGTAQALSGLRVKVAAKTGTAEIGSGKSVNSWFIGFVPYEKPKIAMAVVLERGTASNLVGAPSAARQIIEWITVYRPKLLSL